MVSSSAATPTILDPLWSMTENLSPDFASPAIAAKWRTLRRNSRVCCLMGAVTTMVQLGRQKAQWRAFSAVIVDFPDWREQLSMTLDPVL